MRCSPRLVHRLATALLLCCCPLVMRAPICRAADRSSSYLAALESIRRTDLGGHVDYLASDSLQGREAGKRGGRAAGDYVARRLADLSLRGAGVDGGFFQPFGYNYRNVLAKLEGSDPELNQQVVIIAAHYDHVGYGSRRNSHGPIGYVHNGADDNASGTSALLELAQALTILQPPPKRSIVFIAFDAEEKGLLGSKHWTARPTFPLDRVVAVVNIDMIGRLRNNRLALFGSRSGYGMRRLVSTQNEALGLSIDFSWALKVVADHYPFCQRGIPVMMAHTGLHKQYHTPYDDASLIDHSGIARVTKLLFNVVCELADRGETPRFRPAAGSESKGLFKTWSRPAPKLPDRLGVGWKVEPTSPAGVLLVSVIVGSPAEKAGLRPGDRLVRFAGRQTHHGNDLVGAVRAAPKATTLVLRRPGRDEPLELTIQLDGEPMRLGITWKLDEAEPGTVVLDRVLPGTPAAIAGLLVGDRIYQIAGRDFADSAEFTRLAKTLPGPLLFLVERNGQLRTVVVHCEAEPARRAA